VMRAHGVAADAQSLSAAGLGGWAFDSWLGGRRLACDGWGAPGFCGRGARRFRTGPGLSGLAMNSSAPKAVLRFMWGVSSVAQGGFFDEEATEQSCSARHPLENRCGDPDQEPMANPALPGLNRFQVAAQIADSEHLCLGVTHVHLSKDRAPDGHIGGSVCRRLGAKLQNR